MKAAGGAAFVAENKNKEGRGMPAFLKCKKFIVCAVATILAAIAAIIAVSFTYAAYRNEIITDDGATVAGAIADYVRGAAYRNGTETTYNDTDSGISVSELSPGDILEYNFSVNGFRSDGENISYNEVLLRITCEFSFTYAYIEGNNTIPETMSLSAVASGSDSSSADVGFFTGADKTRIDIVNITGETVYFDRKNTTSAWQVTQNSSAETAGYTKYTQKFGFYLYPEKDETQLLGFIVRIPVQRGTSEESAQFKLSVEMHITAEQVLDTTPGTTG